MEKELGQEQKQEQGNHISKNSSGEKERQRTNMIWLTDMTHLTPHSP